MDVRRPTRREFLAGAGATIAYLGLAACGPGRTAPGPSATAPGTGLPKLPATPVNLTIIDVAGQLQLTKPIIDEYASTHPQYVANVGYLTATAPELPAKIKAEQAANQVVTSAVLTGSDALSAGVQQGIWERLLPNYQAKWPHLMQNYLQPRAEELAQGYGILDVFGNYGPTLTYNPAKVPDPPRSADDLLQWARAHPGQLIYARPANSGPGRSTLMGLPYILGDAKPREPDTWTKTWAYLAELGKYVDYYPTGTSATFKELGQGARSIAFSTMGWDMNVRVLGTIPKDFKATGYAHQHLIADTQYVCVPKGLDQGTLAVVLDLIAYLLQPDQQAKTYDNAYFYPGPAVKDVPLSRAPASSRQAVESVRRPEFDQMIKTLPIEMPLDTASLVKAFDIWDQRIGANKLKTS
jgi:putative spermidine/putrescine transport system substrate-binding protein